MLSDLGTTTLVALAVGPILTFIVLRKVVKAEPDRFIARVIVIGFAAKMAGTAAYYLMVAEVWGGGDVARYVRAGRSLVPIIRSGTLPDEARRTGTRFMEFLTGLVFSVVGPNEIAGYVVFSMLSFVGLFLFLHAFRLGMPYGDHRRYAVLVLLTPTVLFWPSTIGKEAWMVFTMGAAAYGAARVLRARPFGYLLLGTALAGVAAIRPHMAVLMALAFTIGYFVRLRDRTTDQTALFWAAGLVVVAVGASITAANFSDEMGDGGATDAPLTERVRSDTESIFERTDRNTRRGGGEFDSRPVRSPVDFVHAAITVPFRPLLTEAHNRTAVLSALEGMVILVILLTALPRFVGPKPVRLSRQPYLVFSAAFTTGFIIAFSNVGNFGILVRQRAMLLPLLLVLACVPRIGATPAGAAPSRPAGDRPVLTILPDTPPAKATQVSADASRSARVE